MAYEQGVVGHDKSKTSLLAITFFAIHTDTVYISPSSYENHIREKGGIILTTCL